MKQMAWRWYPDTEERLRLLAEMPDKELLAEAQQKEPDINNLTLILSEIRGRGLWPTYRQQRVAADATATEGDT